MKLKTIGCFVLLKFAEILAVVSVLVWLPCLAGMGVFAVFPRIDGLNNVFDLWRMGFCTVFGIPFIIFFCYVICTVLPDMWSGVVEFIESNWERAKKLSGDE